MGATDSLPTVEAPCQQRVVAFTAIARRASGAGVWVWDPRIRGWAGGAPRWRRGYTGLASGSTPREVALRGSELAHHLVDVLVDRMVSDVVLLDLTSLAVFTDYFVIGTVDNVRQLRAVADALEEAARSAGLSMREEGAMSSGWVLVDFSDVVVHLFSMEKRAYYDLEELWSRAQEVVHIQ